jgi:hypothetical protein
MENFNLKDFIFKNNLYEKIKYDWFDTITE